MDPAHPKLGRGLVGHCSIRARKALQALIGPIEHLIRYLTLVRPKLRSPLRRTSCAGGVSRLRVCCVRWQHDDKPIPANSHEVLAEDAVCLLDVPVNKTGTAFTKPVDGIVGEAVATWEAARPPQPLWLLPDGRASRAPVLPPRPADRILPTSTPVISASLPQSRRAIRGRARPDHQPPGASNHRDPALQCQGADEPVRAAGVARPSLTRKHATLHQNQPDEASPVIHGRRLFRPQSACGLGADRPGRGPERSARRGGLAALRPRAWLLHLRTLFDQCPHRMACARCDFYVPKGSTPSPAIRGKRQPPADACVHPAQR